MRTVLPALVLGFSLPAVPAAAQFAVCNQSYDVVNVAIGQQVEDTFETQGWWTIGTNQCANVIREELQNRFLYVYAMDVFGQPLLPGSTPMCIDTPFPPPRGAITGITDCWVEGYRQALFYEVDTQATVRWTLFLSPREAP